MEQKIADIEGKMSEGVVNEELLKMYEEKKSRLDQAMSEWSEENENLEHLKATIDNYKS